MHDIAMIEVSSSDLSKPLLGLIAGPYLSSTNGDPQKIAHNRERLESYALPIYERGHLPMVGEWMALPIIQAYQYPVAHRLMERCDAVLRIPGKSRGADLDVRRARALGQPGYTAVGELPLSRNLGGTTP